MTGERTENGVRLELSLEELQVLGNALTFYTDEGPEDEGWQSDELKALSNDLSTIEDRIL